MKKIRIKTIKMVQMKPKKIVSSAIKSRLNPTLPITAPRLHKPKRKRGL